MSRKLNKIEILELLAEQSASGKRQGGAGLRGAAALPLPPLVIYRFDDFLIWRL